MSDEIPTVQSFQIQTLEATIDLKHTPNDYVDDVNSLTYPQKAQVIREMIAEEFEQCSDPFVKQSLKMFGPKIILTCHQKGYATPGERFAQLLLESSKVVNGERVWSNLTLIHNNFGGVKASKHGKATPPLKTEEVLKGKRGVYKLRFAAFDNKWEGMDHYLKVVSLPRYKKAMRLKGTAHFKALANAHYCTEPAESYARLCMGFYNKYELKKLNKILEAWVTASNTGHTQYASASTQ